MLSNCVLYNIPKFLCQQQKNQIKGLIAGCHILYCIVSIAYGPV